MKNINTWILVVLFLTLATSCQKSQDRSTPPEPKESVKGFVVEPKDTPGGDWFIKDPTLDALEGVSSERAQTEFALKNQRQIIVAVIDNGVDIHHEDLKNKIWTNPGESGVDGNGHDKANNAIDDDQNGYVDDVHGWNFLGGKDGRNVGDETLEVTRESLRYDQKIANGDVLTDGEKKYFEKVNADYNQQVAEAKKMVATLAPIEAKATPALKVLRDKLHLEDFSADKLNAITSTDPEVLQARDILLDVIKTYRTVTRFYSIWQTYQTELQFSLNKDFNPRTIVGDDPNDFSQTDYGNNDLLGTDGSHGSHCSGIIAAERNNGIGINGVADNVRIMVLRAVPNGDERDKDIALAVRYAVKNGAQVISMSFGKAYSPSKPQVDAAFLLAAEKGILLFHAAGNSAMNNDLVSFFPNRDVLDSSVKNQPAQISTWIEVGASAQKRGLNMVASFSDYGKKEVDLFAPGYQLNSTIPGNQYAVYSGTSMATPAAAGVGALLLSNFDGMTGPQAKAILLRQARTYDGLEVHLPGSAALDLPVPFASLSATGGVIDAYRSVQLARDLVGN